MIKLTEFIPPGLQKIRERKASGGFTKTGTIIVDEAKVAAFQKRWASDWPSRWVFRDGYFFPREGTL